MKAPYFLLCLIFLLPLFHSCNSVNETPKDQLKPGHYKIMGHDFDQEGEKVFITDSIGNILAQTTIKDGKFALSEIPSVSMAFIYVANKEKTAFFLDSLVHQARPWDNNNSRFFITSKNEQQIAYNDYQQDLSAIEHQLYLLYSKLEDRDKQSQKDIQKDILELKDKQKVLVSNFVKNNNTSFIALFELKQYAPFLGAKTTRQLMAKTDSLLQKSKMGKELADMIQENNANTKEQPKEDTPKKGPQKPTAAKVQKKPERFPAPLFNGLSPEGYLVDLSTLVGQNKILMLDFWATWCEPCRMQNPFWVRLYKRFHSKGFEILSIAEETEESMPSLSSAIEQDKMSWKHIVDQNFEIAELYGAYSLPHAVLVDQEGKIIYHKATARDIEEFLVEYFNK